MIRSNVAFFEAVGSIVRALDARGHPGYAAALRAALTISTAPGEVLGATREQLRQLLERRDIDVGIRTLAEDAFRYVNDVLNS